MGCDGCRQGVLQHCFITISEAHLKCGPHLRAKGLKREPAWQFPWVQRQAGTRWPLSAGVCVRLCLVVVVVVVGGCKCQARPENLSAFLSLFVGWDTPLAGLGKVTRLIREVRLLE